MIQFLVILAVALGIASVLIVSVVQKSRGGCDAPRGSITHDTRIADGCDRIVELVDGRVHGDRRVPPVS